MVSYRYGWLIGAKNPVWVEMQIGFWESEISVSSKMVRVVREAASHEKRVPWQECKNWHSVAKGLGHVWNVKISEVGAGGCSKLLLPPLWDVKPAMSLRGGKRKFDGWLIECMGGPSRNLHLHTWMGLHFEYVPLSETHFNQIALKVKAIIASLQLTFLCSERLVQERSVFFIEC